MALANRKSNKRVARYSRGSQPARARADNKRRFAKGDRAEEDKRPNKRGRGRPPGATNYFTREVKEAIINAANRFGRDGHGQDGLEGYMLKLAGEEPKTFGMLLRAIMPTQVTVEHKDEPIETEEDVRKELARFGLALEDLRTPSFHSEKEILQLTARDVTDDDKPVPDDAKR